MATCRAPVSSADAAQAPVALRSDPIVTGWAAGAESRALPSSRARCAQSWFGGDARRPLRYTRSCGRSQFPGFPAQRLPTSTHPRDIECRVHPRACRRVVHGCLYDADAAPPAIFRPRRMLLGPWQLCAPEELCQTRQDHLMRRPGPAHHLTRPHTGTTINQVTSQTGHERDSM